MQPNKLILANRERARDTATLANYVIIDTECKCISGIFERSIDYIQNYFKFRMANIPTSIIEWFAKNITGFFKLNKHSIKK